MLIDPEPAGHWVDGEPRPGIPPLNGERWRRVDVECRAVDGRHERIARNEAMYRAVNRELEEASEDAGGGPDAPLEILCECGEPGCNTMLTLTIGEYDEAHGQRDRFIVAVEHEDPQIERVVVRRDRYLVVDKFGEAEQIAVKEEQRGDP